MGKGKVILKILINIKFLIQRFSQPKDWSSVWPCSGWSLRTSPEKESYDSQKVELLWIDESSTQGRTEKSIILSVRWGNKSNVFGTHFWLFFFFQVDSEAELMEIRKQALMKQFNCCMIRDAGRTQIEPNTKVKIIHYQSCWFKDWFISFQTVLAIGPNSSREIDRITGHLKLL